MGIIHEAREKVLCKPGGTGQSGGSHNHSLLLFPSPKRISQPATDHIPRTQRHRGPANQASRAEFTPQTLFPPSREEHVGGAPGGRHTRGVLLVAVDVEVGGEEHDRGEGDGEELQGSEVLGRYEGGG